MFTKSLLAALAGLAAVSAQSINGPVVPGTTGQLGDAPVTTNNPAGVVYQATLPNSTTSGIRGSISGTTTANGTGVQFTVNFSGFPSSSLGPFMYHIHDKPLAPNGSCATAAAHLDPYLRGEKPPCDPTTPEQCQTGDLAGKHGNLTVDPFQASYVDLYSSTAPGTLAFFGNRSIVVHTSNATRLTCANFTLVSVNSTSSRSPSSPSSTPPVFTGGAATNVISVAAVAAGLLASLL